ncbi:hypothetical protein PENTCL1PPCAC_28110, partial [Pristionchus entomophagus]
STLWLSLTLSLLPSGRWQSARQAGVTRSTLRLFTRYTSFGLLLSPTTTTMHFKRVANTINRPHFIAEKDGEVLLLNFCQDHMTMRCRTLDLPSEETQDSMGGFGTSVFGFDDDRVSQRAKVPKSKKTAEFKLKAHSKHGLGADVDGKIYFLDDLPKTDTTNVWRVDCETGDNEFTKIPSGFITRFSDSDYFVVTNFRDSNKAAIYQWRARANAELIKTITIPNGMNDHTRLAYGSKLIWVKIEGDSINVRVLDVIAEKSTTKTFALANAGDPTARWMCAKNNLLAILSGRVIFIGLQSLTCDNDPTNLDPSEKHHPFGVDSNGFIYVLSPTKGGSSVQRVRDVTLSTEIETHVVIPKKEIIKEPKPLVKDGDKHITIHFHVTHRGRILLDQSMKMLTTQSIGQMIRYSPETPQPPETRLKIFFNEEEHLTIRTPNFLKLKDGDTIYAEYRDIDASSEAKKGVTSYKTENTGFFPQAMLEELNIVAPRKNEDQKVSSPKAQDSKMMTQRNVPPHLRKADPVPPQLRAATAAARTPPVQAPMNGVAQNPAMRPGEYVAPHLRNAPTQAKEEYIPPHLRTAPAQAPGAPANGVAQDPHMMQPIPPHMRSPPIQVLRALANGVDTPAVPNVPAVPVDPALRLAEAAEAKATMNEKLLAEMQWLRSFVSGEFAKTAVRLPENYELELLQKKYARTLLMMGRSEVQK